MSVQLKNAPQRSYEERDHDTWRRLVVRQLELIRESAPSMYWEGFERLQLPHDRLPAQDEMSERLYSFDGWRLSNAQNEYLNHFDWFVHLREKHFPVTDYIRPPEDIEYTPYPDLFHEYFGHLAWMTLPRYNVIVDRFTRRYFALPEEERARFSNAWWFTLEFGLLRENGKIHPLGAGLYSSPAELQYALASPHLYRPLTIEDTLAATSSPHAFHDVYFVLDGFEHLEELTKDW